MQLHIKRLNESAKLPEYANPGDAGLDLFANHAATLMPGEPTLIRTGIAIQLPKDTEAQIRPRSGLALKHAITVLNAPGTIDQGFRGEVGVILINHGKYPHIIDRGAKIAQMVIAPVLRVEVIELETLTDSARGANGFGSTGY